MSETKTTENAAAPDIFDGENVSGDPDWQAAMDGDEAGEGEAAKTGEEGATEQSGVDSEADKTETGQAAKPAAETAETAEKPAGEESGEAEKQKPSPQVPIQALHEEREKRQGLERQLAELKGRFEEFSKPPSAPQLDREAEVQKLMESGELNHTEAEIRLDQERINQELAEQKEFRANLENEKTRQSEIQIVQAEYSSAAVKFTEKQSDFNDAYNYALNARATQLRFEHPDATEAQINNSIYMSEINLAAAAIKAGKDPAETVYEYAKTFGYQAPKGEGDGASKENGKGAGETEAEKKLLNIQKGDEASRSASGGSSGDTGEGLTFDSLKNKKGKEFDSGWDELVPRQDSIFD